jgi:phosphoribosyl-ATP pyrophosphohydrolase
MDDLEHDLRRLYGAYEYLRDTDLTAESNTSRLLHAPDYPLLAARVGQEVAEMLGVLFGTHRHRGLPDDLVLEASQVCYWVFCNAVARHVSYDDLAPHLALRDRDADRADDPPDLLAYLRGEDPAAQADPGRVRALQAFLRGVGKACRQEAVLPLTVVRADLAAMAAKPYLAGYFGG